MLLRIEYCVNFTKNKLQLFPAVEKHLLFIQGMQLWAEGPGNINRLVNSSEDSFFYSKSSVK